MNSVDRRIRIGNWLVPYDDAAQEVSLQRTVKDVLTATPGDDGNCMNSRCIKAHRKERVFPHPVYLVSTIKTRVYIVDALTDIGEPAHAIRYEISERDSRLIGEHDAYGAGEPGELRLRIPTDPKGSPVRATNAAKSGKPRYAGRERYSGTGSYSGKQRRPVTSVGAKARFKVAVGALSDD